MTALRSCSWCGTELPEGSPEAACPRCLSRPSVAEPTGAGAATAAHWGPAAVPAPAELAQHFPQLEILGLVGRGGMGAVYRARQPRLDRLVALKVLPPEAGRDPAFAERFTREARALARLNHPHIVTVHEIGEANGLHYFLMEFASGGNLRQLLNSGQPSVPEVLRLGAQVCEALQYAHDEGVIHRDIKPENILLDRGRVKIADFGLARLLDAAPDGRLTGTRQVMGTPHYMAPEQIERPLAVDQRADLYSLGVVLYELLTGELPLGRFPLPSATRADARLDGVLLRALEKDPARRFPNAGAFKVALESAAAFGAVTEAFRPGPRTEAPAEEDLPVVTPLPEATHGPARWLLAGSTFLAVLLCVLGAAAVFLPWSAVPTLTEEQPVDGLHTWHGTAATVLFLVLGVALLAGGLTGRARLWRPLALFGAGVSVSVLSFLYMGWVAEPKPLPLPVDPVKPIQDFAGKFGEVVPGMGGEARLLEGILSIPGQVARDLKQPGRLLSGPYFALAAAFGLLFLGAVQLRLRLNQPPSRER